MEKKWVLKVTFYYYLLWRTCPLLVLLPSVATNIKILKSSKLKQSKTASSTKNIQQHLCTFEKKFVSKKLRIYLGDIFSNVFLYFWCLNAYMFKSLRLFVSWTAKSNSKSTSWIPYLIVANIPLGFNQISLKITL